MDDQPRHRRKCREIKVNHIIPRYNAFIIDHRPGEQKENTRNEMHKKCK